jgi:hypothetical protein
MSGQNPILGMDASYSGLYYALSGTGGFSIEQGLKTITMLPVNRINQYDVTSSLQVLFPASVLNAKLGTFDTTTYLWPNESITVTNTDFVTNVNVAADVISVGALSTLYSDFILYVNEYFGYANGFSTIFTLSSQIDVNNGVFDANQFIKLIGGSALNPPNPTTGEYVTDLSGSVTFGYINELLSNVINANPFNNRPTTGNGGAGFSLQDGFVAGDLLFVPTGFTITLNMLINTNNITLNNLGTAYVASLNASANYVRGYFSSNTTTTGNEISTTFRVPLLIQLS